MQITGVKSHNSFGAGGSYNTILKHVYNKTRTEHAKFRPDISLALPVRAIKYTVGPSGLFPQLLVFGFTPKIPNPSTKTFPNQVKTFRAIDIISGILKRSIRVNWTTEAFRKLLHPQPTMHIDLVILYKFIAKV